MQKVATLTNGTSQLKVSRPDYGLPCSFCPGSAWRHCRQTPSSEGKQPGIAEIDNNPERRDPTRQFKRVIIIHSLLLDFT
jgi:hypothetical protein